MSKNLAVQESSIAGQVLGFAWIRILPKLRVLISVPILTRLIGPEGYGTLAMVFALIRVVVNVVSLGMRTSLNVMLAQIEEAGRRRREYWSVVHVLAFIGLTVALLLGVLSETILQWFSISLDPFYLILVLPLIPLCALDNVFQVQVMLKRLAHRYARIILVMTWLELALMLVLAVAFRVSGVLAASVVGQAVMVGLTFALICTVEPFTSWRERVPLSRLKEHFAYGSIVFLTGITSWIVDSSDRLMIAAFLDLSKLGVYQVSYSLCAHLSDLAVPLISAVVPVVMLSIAQSDRGRALYVLTAMYRILVLIYAPAVIFFSLAAYDILLLLTTDDFLGGAAIVPWVAAGTAIFRLNGINTNILHAHKRPHSIFLSSVGASALNIGINLYAIPRYGIVAAGVSTFVAYCFDFLVLRWLAGKYLVVPMQWGWLLRVAAALIPLWFSIRLVQMVAEAPLYRILLSGMLGGFSYLSALFLLKCFTFEERQWIQQIVLRRKFTSKDE